MNTTSITTLVSRLPLFALTACGLVNCASVEHPLTRHDMNGDGVISPSEYQQQDTQYNLASRQRDDEYSRARLLTAHMENAGNFLDQTNRVVNILGNFGH